MITLHMNEIMMILCYMLSTNHMDIVSHHEIICQNSLLPIFLRLHSLDLAHESCTLKNIPIAHSLHTIFLHHVPFHAPIHQCNHLLTLYLKTKLSLFLWYLHIFLVYSMYWTVLIATVPLIFTIPFTLQLTYHWISNLGLLETPLSPPRMGSNLDKRLHWAPSLTKDFLYHMIVLKKIIGIPQELCYKL